MGGMLFPVSTFEKKKKVEAAVPRQVVTHRVQELIKKDVSLI